MKLLFLCSAILFATSSWAQRVENISENPRSTIREVIFFTMSSEEMYNLTLESGDESAFAEVDEFDLYAQMFSEGHNLTGINVRTTDMKEISLGWGNGKEFRLRRDFDKNKIGIILYDGKREPKVIRGILTDQQIKSEVRKYFGI